MESSQGLYEVDKRDSIVSILQMRKLNLSEEVISQVPQLVSGGGSVRTQAVYL